MDGIFESIKSWIMSVIRETVEELLTIERDRGETLLLSRKKVAAKLGMSPGTFDKYYRYSSEMGFPKELPGCFWSREAVEEWVKKQK